MMNKPVAYLLALLSAIPAYGQLQNVGAIARDFTATQFDASGTDNLYAYAGEIIVLEWFSWWCPFCVAAAAQTEAGIVQHYKANGHPDAIPVRHIGLNLEASGLANTRQFITKHGFELVLQDTTRSIFRQFEPGSGQPLFAIINGVANSPSHQQWEILYTLNNFGSSTAPIETMRAVIDSVKAPHPAPESPWAAFTDGDGNKHSAEFGDSGFGWIQDGFYPFIYSYAFANDRQGQPAAGWLYVFPDNASLHGFFAYVFATGDWIWTSNSNGGWYFNLSRPETGFQGWSNVGN